MSDSIQTTFLIHFPTQAYYILDECIMAGEIQESSKREIKKSIREASVQLEDEDEHDVEDLFGIFG